MDYQIEIKGFDKLVKKLGQATAFETIDPTLTQAGLLLQAWSVKNRLRGPRPKYLGVRTGRLYSSIGVYRSINRNEYSVKIGTNVEYARIHEFGGRVGKYGRGIMPARPFLRPAIEDPTNRKDILNILTRAINEALAK